MSKIFLGTAFLVFFVLFNLCCLCHLLKLSCTTIFNRIQSLNSATLTVLDSEEDQTLQPGTDTTTKTFIFFKDFKLLAKFV